MTVDVEVVNLTQAVEIETSASADVPVDTENIPAHSHDNRYYTKEQTNNLLNEKVDKETGKGLSSNDYTDEDKSKVNTALQAGDNVSNLANDAGYLTEHQSLAEYRKSAAQDEIDASKVDKVTGKGLSTNDYTNAEKALVASAVQPAALTDYRKAADQDEIDDEIKSDIDAIEAKIPSAASSSNQLADKSFVNSSIATNTANYISDNGQPFASVAALLAYTGSVTNNDYAFVTGTDEHGNTYFDRYKATVNGTAVSWAKEYRLNNSSFTAAQWDAISSGITALLVSSYNAHLANTDIHITAAERTAWNAKQAAITDLATIRSGASAGATAIQPNDNVSALTNDAGYLTLSTLPKYDGGYE